MSVMIKGMEIPSGCYDCPILQSSDGCFDFECPFDSYLLWHNAEDVIRYRPDSCPLVEIPTPHGRLIDADELKKNMRNYYPSIDHLCCSQHVVTKRDIDCAPTIIEAEVE